MDAGRTGVLIVGAGQAGATAAAALRDFGYQDRIVVVGSEQPLPYERPPLSKTMLSGSGAVGDILVHPAGFHEEKSIETMLGVGVSSLDVHGHTAVLKNGKAIAWQHCVIATGGKARTIAGLLPGTARIHYLRTLADALRLREEMRQSRSVLIVGGGFLGLEVASTARSMSLSATVLESGDRVLGRALPADMSSWLHQSITTAGVDLRLNTQCESFDVRTDGVSIDLASGERLSADMIVIAVGLEPEVGIARHAGLSIHSRNGGICVDEHCMTSAPDVYAAGDCSSQNHPFMGSEIRLESWQNANEQARLAAAAIAGVPTTPLTAPWFWSDQFGCNLQILGMPVDGLLYHRRGDFGSSGAAPKFLLLGANVAGQILHAIALNAGGDLRQLKLLVDSKTPCDPILLCDATTPLRTLVRAALAPPPPPPFPKPESGMHSNHAVLNRTVRSKDADLSVCVWPEDAMHFIPDWVYTNEAVYGKEMELIFRGRTWNYVALEAEIPNAGDYKRSYVGDTPVVVSRAEDGSISVFENRCAHRGAEFCRHGQGNAKEFVCPYHQWSYDLKGNLQGVPFKRGVNKTGGMPKDFRNEEHGLKKLFVTSYCGVVFASYSADVEPIEEYLGPEMLKDFDIVFKGRKLKVLGYYKNELPCNWKMYHENLKDPYHATLLHSFLVVFGLLVAGNKSAMIADSKHCRHGTMASAKSEDKYAVVSSENKKEMRSFHEGMHLRDDRFLEFVKEFDSEWSVTMQTVWPNLVVQREMNTLGVRQIVPNGPNSMLMQWTMFGYEDDTEEMTQHRLRQGNLMGPAGFLGLEDNEAMKFVQEGVRRSSSNTNVIKLDADRVGTSETLISEACIRGMYQYYRQVMGF